MMIKQLAFISASYLFLAIPGAWCQQSRPAITGISHMCVYASDAKAAEHFYADILGASRGPDPQNANGVRFYFSPSQFVEVLPLPSDHGLSRMGCVAYTTADANGLRSYLQAHGVTDGTTVQTGSDGSRWFTVKDPEGNEVQFIQTDHAKPVASTSGPIGTRIIHVGYMVHNKAVEDHFYKEILGFRPYWFGAMKPNAVDWVSQQVPDGHDWLEYMLVGDGSTTPLDHVDQRELGVLNHFSIGVPNMEKAVTILMSQDRLSPRHDGPQMGKDGKWQANLYDPDDTRVELMEFQPVMMPCCSSFTAESPSN